MKVRAEYTVYKSMEIEIPKALKEAYHKAVMNQDPFDVDEAYDNISEFVGTYVKAEEGDNNVDCVIDWDEIED